MKTGFEANSFVVKLARVYPPEAAPKATRAVLGNLFEEALVKLIWKHKENCRLKPALLILKFLNVDLTGQRRNFWVLNLKVGRVLRNAPRTATESRPYL